MEQPGHKCQQACLWLKCVSYVIPGDLLVREHWYRLSFDQRESVRSLLFWLASQPDGVQ